MMVCNSASVSHKLYLTVVYWHWYRPFGVGQIYSCMSRHDGGARKGRCATKLILEGDHMWECPISVIIYFLGVSLREISAGHAYIRMVMSTWWIPLWPGSVILSPYFSVTATPKKDRLCNWYNLSLDKCGKLMQIVQYTYYLIYLFYIYIYTLYFQFLWAVPKNMFPSFRDWWSFYHTKRCNFFWRFLLTPLFLRDKISMD